MPMYEMKNKNTERSILLLCLLIFGSTQFAFASCSDKRSPGMDWSGCKKTSKMLGDSNFTGSRFDSANLALSNLDESNFTGASMVKVDMTRASFIQAVIKDVDWSRSELGRADFSKAQLDNVKFVFSNLSRVLFADSRLNNVDFSGAYTYRTHFENVDLSEVKGLTQMQIKNACGNDKTLLPGSLSKPESWPCSE
jgi:uncharacterized protein YjbI with pentapeptide repeats